MMLKICVLAFFLEMGLSFEMPNDIWALPPDNQKDTKCATEQYPPQDSDKIPTYVINLDLPPEERWSELMRDKKEKALELLQDIKNYSASFFHGKLFKLIDIYLPKMAKTLPEPYLSELQGIAKVTNLPLGEITLYNIFYEVFSVCTSIIAQGADGRLFHARNLDFGLFLGWDVKNHTWLTTEALRPLVVELDFQRNNQTVFKSVNFAGYIGVLTGMKPNRFTLTLDERFSLDGGFVGIIRWLMGDRTANWSGFLMRDVLDKAPGYPEALSILTTSKLLAPVYFILGGNVSEQGAVITRGRNDADVWFMGRGSVSQTSTWYLVETNYDHWSTPPFYDDRRTPAIHCLDAVGRQNITIPAIFNVLSTRPVLNKLTAYTTLMELSTGQFDTWLRFCTDPCSPW